jgi:NAD(P)-dependent dehydrogenase (short-subunit alcohol dehydrogenase family)
MKPESAEINTALVNETPLTARSHALATLVENRPTFDGHSLFEPQKAAEISVDALFSLKGKVAVLTDVGGTGSREVAFLLASAGAQIVFADRDLAAAEAVVSDVMRKGGHAVALHIDIEKESSVIQLFDDVARSAGQIDILINCAGMSANQPLVETSIEVWDEMQSFNLRANFLCMREAVKKMVAIGRGGRIVNITSICAVHPVMNGNASYAAARLGVTGLSRSAALDYVEQGILINTLLAGAMPNKVKVHPEIAAKLKAGRQSTGPLVQPGRKPLGFGNMTDIAAAVLYLVSPAGRFVTGQSLAVDGGFMLT